MLKAKTARNLRVKNNDVSSGRDKYFSRAVSKALEVLEILQTESNALSMNEIAQRLDIGRVTVYAMLGQGILPGIRLGRRWIITRHAYAKWERTCGTQPILDLSRKQR